ncbi:MAG: hypothetical protein WDA27_14320 [Actinomycetota bacterium]
MLSDETIEEAKTELPEMVKMVPAESTIWVHEPCNVLLQHAQHRATDADLRDVLKALPLERLSAVLEPWLIKPTTVRAIDSDEGVVVQIASQDPRAALLIQASKIGAKMAMAIFFAQIPATPKEPTDGR